MSQGYPVDLAVLPAFLGLVILICLAPGPDMVYLVGTGIVGGRGAATRGALGVSLGVLVYAVAVAAGLGAIVADHQAVLSAVQFFGCLYLLWLAVSTFKEARDTVQSESPRYEQRAWFRRGLVVNLTNPKVLLFFLAFLPQFLGSATNATLQLLLLGVLFQLVGLVVDLSIGWGAGTFQKVLSRPSTVRLMTYASGTVFTALAAFIGTEVVQGVTNR